MPTAIPRRAAQVVAAIASALALVASTSACQQEPSAPTVRGSTRVLFVGNSLTYVHAVPALVQAIARQVGDTGLATAAVAFPNYSLEDHWRDGSASRALSAQRWEFVVMQQGPSSLPENRALLEQWVRTFEPLVRSAGATPVLYQVWPEILRRGDAPAVLLSYANAARAVNGRLAPAGAAWDSALTIASPLAVYANDGLHASPHGAWLAAVVLYATLRDVDPVTLPAALPAGIPTLPADRVRELLRRASLAIAGARR